MNPQQAGGVRAIRTLRPRPEGNPMGNDLYYEYIYTNVELRLASGVDELTAKTWPVEAEVCQWDGEAGSFYIEVSNEELVRGGIRPDEAVVDKAYPYHTQLGWIGADRAQPLQNDLHALGHQVTLDLQKWSWSTYQTGYLLSGGSLRALLHARFAGWGLAPPLSQFHISF